MKEKVAEEAEAVAVAAGIATTTVVEVVATAEIHIAAEAAVIHGAAAVPATKDSQAYDAQRTVSGKMEFTTRAPRRLAGEILAAAADHEGAGETGNSRGTTGTGRAAVPATGGAAAADHGIGAETGSSRGTTVTTKRTGGKMSPVAKIKQPPPPNHQDFPPRHLQRLRLQMPLRSRNLAEPPLR